MALPKQKTSKERQRKRRSHLSITATASLKTCPQCGSPRLNHHACPTCGSYAGREVVQKEAPKKKGEKS